MKKQYTLLSLLFIILSGTLFSQLKIKVVVDKIRALNTVNCDSPNNSDFLFEFKATDNSPMAYSNNNPVMGSIGLCNYALVNENNGPFTFTPSAPGTAVFSPTNAVFFDRSYACNIDVPSVISITWRGYENDEATAPSTSPIANGITAISTHTVGITIQNPIVFTNSYTVTSTDVGCSQTYELTISVLLTYGTFVPLFIDHVHESIICPAASTGTLEGHPIGGSGVVVNDWSNDGLGDYDDPLLISGLSAGTYTFISKDALNCTDTLVAHVIVQNPPAPITAFDVSTANICTGQTNILYSVPTTTNLIYYWNYTGSGTTYYNNPNNNYFLNFSNTASNGIISVYAKNSCSVSPTLTLAINVTQTPTLSLTGNNFVCDNAQAILSASGASNYLWNTGAVTSSITVYPANTTTYSVIGSNGSCIDTKQFVLTVLPTPTIVINGPASLVCPGQTVTLTSSGNGSLFLWSDGFNGTNNTVLPSSTVVYTVSNILNSCIANATFTLNVHPLPPLSVSGNTIVCVGKTLTLTASGTDTYSWSTGSTNSSITYTPSGLYSLNVIGTNTITGCKNTNTVSVNTYSAGLVSITGNTTICNTLSGVFTASGSNFYLWNNGIVNNTNTITPTAPTTVSVVGTTINGCKDSTTLAIDVVNNISILITGGDSVCMGQNTTLTTSVTGATSYSWNNGAITPTIAVSPINTNTYSVTAANAGCTTTLQHTVVVKSLPLVSFNLNTPICSNAAFYGLIGMPLGGIYNGAGVSGNTFDPAGVGVGNYSITYQVTGVNGCLASITQTLDVVNCVGIEENETENFVNIYPNPSQHKVTISLNLYLKSVIIFDYTGKLLCNYEYTHVKQTEIDLSTFNSGIYTFKIITSNGNYKSVKVLKL